MRLRVLALLLALTPTGPASAAVTFQTSDFAKVLETARSEQKPVMIDFYADWCGPCKLLDQYTWTDEAVSKASHYFVNLKIDTEAKEGAPFAQQYQVSGLPLILFLDPAGNEVGREVGYRAPAAMLVAMRRALRSGGGELVARMADAEPEDAELQLETAQAMVSQKRWDRAETYLVRAKALAPTQKVRYQADVSTATAQLAEAQSKLEDALSAYREAARLESWNVARLNAFAWFCATRRQALDEALPIARQAVQLSERTPGILDTLAELHHARGEHNEAIEVIDEAIRAMPDDPYYQQQRDKFVAAREKASTTDAARRAEP